MTNYQKQEEFLTRENLAERWKTTIRTVDRRRKLGLLPWHDLAGGRGKRPQVRFKIEDIETYEQQMRQDPSGKE